MYIWTIPPAKQKRNVLSLRAAKGKNGGDNDDENDDDVIAASPISQR